MKKIVRLNESELKHMIMESVKRVLEDREFHLRNKSRNQRMVLDVLKRLGVKHLDSIDWLNDNYFQMLDDGTNGSIFPSVEDARNSVLYGDDHQNAVDYVDGAQSDEDWIEYLINGGVDEETAETIIRNHDWDTVVEIIVDKCGPEWFLSTYSGEVYGLPDGSLLYY